MITEVESDTIDGAFVETWHDDLTGNFVTQLKTPSGFQVGNAKHAGTRRDAELNHGDMLAEADKRLLEATSRHV